MHVKDAMSSDVVMLSPEDSVTKFISLVEERKIHEVPIVENKKLLGMVRFRNLTSRGITDPSKQRLRNFIDMQPPKLSTENTLEEGAKMLAQTGLRAVPVLEREKVVGILSITDIVRSALNSKIFRQTTAKQIMSVPEVLYDNESVGKARVLMREKNISMLPVVDKGGNYLGGIESTDLLQVLKNPHEKIGWYSMAADMDRLLGLPITTILNRNAPTSGQNKNVKEIAEVLLKNRINGLTILENGKPVGVVTLKDLLELFISTLERKGVYYQIAGLHGEDSFSFDTVDRMIQDSLKKIAKIYPPQYFFIHFKKHQEEGLRTKYSVRARLMTDRGMFISKAWKWDAREAANEALARLERSVMEWKSKKRDLMRDNKRKSKEER